MTATLIGWLKALGPLVLGAAIALAALWSQLSRTGDILDWVKALAPSSVALAVLVVTGLFYYWQVRLAKQKLRHDLYDRRFAIYTAFGTSSSPYRTRATMTLRPSFERQEWLVPRPDFCLMIRRLETTWRIYTNK